MTFKYNPRRLLDDSNPDGDFESDRDYLENNRELAIRLLDEYQNPFIPAGYQQKSALETIELARAEELLKSLSIRAIESSLNPGTWLLYGAKRLTSELCNKEFPDKASALKAGVKYVRVFLD